VVTEFPPSPSTADRIGLCVPRSTQCVCVQALPLRVNAQAAPAGPTKGDRPRSALLGPGPPTIGGVAVRRQRDGHAVIGVSHCAGADQPRPLLEDLRRRKLSSTNRPLPRALSVVGCARLRVVGKTGICPWSQPMTIAASSRESSVSFQAPPARPRCNSWRNSSRFSWMEAMTSPVPSPSRISVASDSCRLASMVSGTASVTPIVYRWRA
jgi:hypothetical protein